jgi:hypothetical protein
MERVRSLFVGTHVTNGKANNRLEESLLSKYVMDSPRRFALEDQCPGRTGI